MRKRAAPRAEALPAEVVRSNEDRFANSLPLSSSPEVDPLNLEKLAVLDNADAGILLELLDCWLAAAATPRDSARSLCCCAIGVLSFLCLIDISKEFSRLSGVTILVEGAFGRPVDLDPDEGVPPSISTLPAPDTSSRNAI